MKFEIDRAAYVALVTAIAACHGGEVRMLTAPVEPDAPPDGGAGDAAVDDVKRVSCDDDVRARKCSDLRCPTEENVATQCATLRKRLRPSAFNRFLDCAVEKAKNDCDGMLVASCLEFPEGRCIDPPTEKMCESTLRNCSVARPMRKRAPAKMTQSQCQAIVSAAQPRNRAALTACMNESCDLASVRERCILE